MRDSNKLISIIMPAFNAEKTICRAIDSVLSQTYSDFEIFVIDDCSNDNTLRRIQSYRDPRIIVIKNTHNLGAPKSRNLAIKKAKGRFLCFLDADDEWMAEKLAIQSEALITSGAAIAAHGYELFNSLGKSSIFMPPRIIEYDELLKFNVISNCATMIDLDIVGHKVYFKNLRSRQDWAMSLEVTKNHGPALGIQRNLLNVYIQKDSVSSNKKNAVIDQWILYREVEKLGLLKSWSLLIGWAIRGFIKYSKLD